MATNKCKIFHKVLLAYKNMNAEMLSKLHQFIDIFSIRHLRVCLTFFSDSVFPRPISDVVDTSLKY